MRGVWKSCALIFVVAAAVAIAADSDANELFKKARAGVLNNIRRTPRYTCVENIVRAQYAPAVKAKAPSCAALIEARRQHRAATDMIWRDRLRLDVAVVDGAEMFSWAGAGKFETDSLDKLVGTGSTGSGDFAAFLTSIFGIGPDALRYRGLENDLAAFDYTVSLAHSHYTYGTRGVEKTIGYGGSFFVDPADGELQRLIVETEPFPQGEQACLATDVMEYHTVKIGSGDFMLPELATMNVLFQNGAESHNETRYSDCREYTGESTIRFDDVETSSAAAISRTPLPPLPKNLRLQLALSSPINGETAAAGDPVTATVLRDVKAKGGGVLVHASDKVHGRILRIEQDFLPAPRWTLVLRFEGIERNGLEEPVTLEQLGGSEFHFPGRGQLALDQKFHSDWEIR
ncbi:MAG TPA: hypothetical protein VG273_04805 [Bryobacteraceae bacterium]|jgi:hypothetical protein|nr:hypothetical protein [Bryobacteraceae bacterium]